MFTCHFVGITSFYSVKLLFLSFFGNESLSSAHTQQSGGIKLHLLEESMFTYMIWNSKSHFNNVFHLRILPPVDLYFVSYGERKCYTQSLVCKPFLFRLCPE